MRPVLILINPWIYDFAAYDLWAKPLGLLYLAGYLRQCGFGIHFIDCLGPLTPRATAEFGLKMPPRGPYGTGKYLRCPVPKPKALNGISRTYSRYGLPYELVEQALSRVSRPSAILITSLMTYWYPGVQAAIAVAKDIHPEVPVILGGIYARLCPDHAARHTGADRVVTDSDPWSVSEVLDEFGVSTPVQLSRKAPWPYPAFDLLGPVDSVSLMTSRGCPLRCRYCASHFLSPNLSRRDPKDVVEEILYWHRAFGVTDFAFYDDALLVGSGTHLKVILKKIEQAAPKGRLRFHTPNALHIRAVTEDLSSLMHRSGFETIRLGLESSDTSFHRGMDNKVCEGEFEQAVGHLLRAGFRNDQIGAYILIGLPGQAPESVRETIEFVDAAGAVPYLSEYSPIPHTGLWASAVQSSPYDLSEPLYHNNTLLPCWDPSKRATLPELKQLALEIRKRYRGASNAQNG